MGRERPRSLVHRGGGNTPCSIAAEEISACSLVGHCHRVAQCHLSSSSPKRDYRKTEARCFGARATAEPSLERDPSDRRGSRICCRAVGELFLKGVRWFTTGSFPCLVSQKAGGPRFHMRRSATLGGSAFSRLLADSRWKGEFLRPQTTNRWRGARLARRWCSLRSQLSQDFLAP